jgi:hypothetical protein
MSINASRRRWAMMLQNLNSICDRAMLAIKFERQKFLADRYWLPYAEAALGDDPDPASSIRRDAP